MVKLKGRLVALAAAGVVVLAACSSGGATTAPEESAAPAGERGPGRECRSWRQRRRR